MSMETRTVLCMVCTLGYVNSATADVCTARVKVQSSGFTEQTLTFKVKVFANKKEEVRTVFYSFSGTYGAQIPGDDGLGVPPVNTRSFFNSSESIQIDQGDDDAEDQIAVAVPLRPIAPPKVNNIIVNGCFVQ